MQYKVLFVLLFFLLIPAHAAIAVEEGSGSILSEIQDVSNKIADEQYASATLEKEIQVQLQVQQELKDSISTLEESIVNIENQFIDTNTRIDEVTDALSIQESAIAQMVQEQYTTGSPTLFSLVFSSYSLSELLENYQSARALNEALTEKVKEYKLLYAHYLSLQVALEEQKASKEASLFEQLSQQEALEASITYSYELRNYYTNNIDAYQEKLLGLEKQQREIDAAIEQAHKEQIERKNEKNPNTPNVPTEKQGIFDPQWPVDSRTITCGFHCDGYPFDRVHSGLDIAVSQGSPVYAAESGFISRVVFDPRSSDLAFILIDHGERYLTAYLHLSCVTVEPYQEVQKGDVIGCSGGTPGTAGAGSTTGPHLHFEVRVNGIKDDPLKYLP